jgi:Coenzyme PQQ synthesis protein D (PqqD)
VAIDSSTVVRRGPDVVFRELQPGQGGVLLRLDSGQYHGLNATGVAIWELLDGERSVGAVAAELARSIDDAPDDLLGDVAGFLEDMRQRGLVDI